MMGNSRLNKTKVHRNRRDDWNDRAESLVQKEMTNGHKIENWVQNEMMDDHKIQNWVQNELTDGPHKLEQQNLAQTPQICRRCVNGSAAPGCDATNSPQAHRQTPRRAGGNCFSPH